MWLKKILQHRGGFIALSIVMLFCISGCSDTHLEKEQVVESEIAVQEKTQNKKDKGEAEEQWKKGYDLPVDDEERKEAERECNKVLGIISDIYYRAHKGEAYDVVLKEKTIHEMQERISESGYAVTMKETYSNTKNYKKVDKFLRECLQGKSGSVVIYEVYSDGGIGRDKFIFDGQDMYIIGASGVWDKEHRTVSSYMFKTRIKEWNYTGKGWFCYELCVPEPPEVSENVEGCWAIRIKPMPKVEREMSEKCVRDIGYQGNNILCSNWDADHMKKLDFNGMYEYLYAMKYGHKFKAENYPDGIPKEEFERVIMDYLPITAEQIREYAIFDKKKQNYLWAGLGCFNYVPTSFTTSLPEVTAIKGNRDGTVILTVDAVCSTGMCDDAVITHKLTVRFAEDGSFQYLGNKILNAGMENIPEYQYRMGNQ